MEGATQTGEDKGVGRSYWLKWVGDSVAYFTLLGIVYGIVGGPGAFLQSTEVWTVITAVARAVFGFVFGGITGGIRVRILQRSKRPLVFGHVGGYVISCTLIGLVVGIIFEGYSPYGPVEAVVGAFGGAVVGFILGAILGRNNGLFEFEG